MHKIKKSRQDQSQDKRKVVKVKVKFILEEATKAQRGSGRIAVLFY